MEHSLLKLCITMLYAYVNYTYTYAYVKLYIYIYIYYTSIKKIKLHG